MFVLPNLFFIPLNAYIAGKTTGFVKWFNVLAVAVNLAIVVGALLK